MSSSVIPPLIDQIKSTLADKIFDHDECRDRIQAFLDDGTIPAGETSLLDFIFARGNNHAGEPRLLSNYSIMTITLPACEALCGHWGWYVDKGPRVMVWVVPILLLLSNIELSPIDKRRFVTLLQSGGDPIDCIWSLVAKLDSRTKIFRLVQEHLVDSSDSSDVMGAGRPWNAVQDRILVIATVLSGLEDVFPAELAASSNTIQIFRQFMNDFGAHTTSTTASDHTHMYNPQIQKQWSKTALELVDARTDERLRAILALVVYILGLCSAFIADMGGTTQTSPGGVIGASLSLSFLIPIVMLSNTIGGYTSRRQVLDIMTRFVEGVDRHQSLRQRFQLVPGPHPQGASESWDSYFSRLHWSGAIDTFRPWKTRESSCHARPRRQKLIQGFIASLPVTAGYLGAFFIILNAAEQGVSCRHIFLTAMYGFWVLSAILSNASYQFKVFKSSKRGRQIHWWLCLAKDCCIAVPSLTFIFLSAAGWFNSCTCWSREPIVGAKNASVYLPVTEIYRRNNRSVFPGIVAGVIGFHLLFSCGLLWWFRDGVSVIRWSEERRQRVWKEVKGEEGFQKGKFLRGAG
ncbi:hypothetical protein QBC44DRAFT_372678 [Cladorrhinum sp. PSN332]|nr:hypothetical protein QBC44DRAFT_372678 [Cladorrhinum sp. PSN332]